MSFFPASFEELIDRFASLPGIGRKSAQRLAFHVLGMPEGEAEAFAETILNARARVHTCPVCQNLTDKEVCGICTDNRRDHTVICVVAEPKDVASLERSREYKGVYHVLHGVLSPLNRIGPDDIRVKELIKRVSEEQEERVQEVIMATNPDTEGDATAVYVSRLLKPFGVRVTRLAYGIPVGSNLEFTDEATLVRALEGRRDM